MLLRSQEYGRYARWCCAADRRASPTDGNRSDQFQFRLRRRGARSGGRRAGRGAAARRTGQRGTARQRRIDARRGGRWPIRRRRGTKFRFHRRRHPATEKSITGAALEAGKRALIRFKQSGAGVHVSRAGDVKRHIYIQLGSGWKGSDADLALLKDIVPLGQTTLSFDPTGALPQAISQLQLPQPLDEMLIYPATDGALEQIKRLPPCKTLMVMGPDLTAAGCRRLAALARDINWLQLAGDGEGKGVGDEGLAELAALGNLKRLSLGLLPITDRGLASVAPMQQLGELTLVRCAKLEKSDLKGLGRIASLRTLDLDVEMAPAGLKHLARLTGLEKLTIIVPQLEPADIEPLAALAQLRQLKITPSVALQLSENRKPGKPPTDAFRQVVRMAHGICRAAGKLPKLESFEIELMPINNTGLEALAAAKTLQSVIAWTAEVNDESLRILGTLPALREIRIFGQGKMSSDGLSPLKPLRRLKTLVIPGDGLTDKSLADLAGLTDLEELRLSGSKISGSGLSALAGCKNLTWLSLDGSRFDDAACALLPALFPRLSLLNLGGTKITDAGLLAIARLKDLIGLDVSEPTSARPAW